MSVQYQATMPCPRCAGTGAVDNPVYQGHTARGRREAAGLKLRQVARQLRVSAPFISDLENGRRLWTGLVAQRYQRFLNSLGERSQASQRAEP